MPARSASRAPPGDRPDRRRAEARAQPRRAALRAAVLTCARFSITALPHRGPGTTKATLPDADAKPRLRLRHAEPLGRGAPRPERPAAYARALLDVAGPEKSGRRCARSSQDMAAALAAPPGPGRAARAPRASPRSASRSSWPRWPRGAKASAC